jgi:hypothetical protein
MSLPLKAIDRLFERLASTYGSEWTARWMGQDEAKVKTVWAHELAAYSNNLEAIAFALENLPPRSPNCIEFKQLCRAAPRKDNAPAIEFVKADPDRVQAEMAKLREVLKSKPATSYDPKAWARIILDRHAAGEPIRVVNLRFAREALGVAA